MNRFLALTVIFVVAACDTKENHDPLPGTQTPVVVSAVCPAGGFQAVTLNSMAADSLHLPGLCVRPAVDTEDIRAVRREQLQTIVEGELPFPNSPYLQVSPLGNQQ
ncbi:MAG TPA: hypothetical protein VJQ25_02975 [Nitrospira sp.]|nr:hypothetical protein [Nitrospira sp.]